MILKIKKKKLYVREIYFLLKRFSQQLSKKVTAVLKSKLEIRKKGYLKICPIASFKEKFFDNYWN